MTRIWVHQTWIVRPHTNLLGFITLERMCLAKHLKGHIDQICTFTAGLVSIFGVRKLLIKHTKPKAYIFLQTCVRQFLLEEMEFQTISAGKWSPSSRPLLSPAASCKELMRPTLCLFSFSTPLSLPPSRSQFSIYQKAHSMGAQMHFVPASVT